MPNIYNLFYKLFPKTINKQMTGPAEKQESQKYLTQKLSSKDILLIMRNLNNTPEEIPTYIHKDNVQKFAFNQIILISGISHKHCKQLLELEPLKDHPDYKKIRECLGDMNRSFEMIPFRDPPKLKPTTP